MSRPTSYVLVAALATLAGARVCGQDPAAPESRPTAPALTDPTVPDSELLRAVGTPRAPGDPAPIVIPPLPSVALKALVAATPDSMAAIIDVAGALVRAVPGATVATAGRTLRVERLDATGLVLVDDARGERVAVDIGAADPNSGPDRLARVDFRGVALDLACRLLSDQSGLNIAVSASAASKEVSLYLRNVEAKTAIRVLCEGHQLWSRHDAETDVLRISTADEYEHDVADLQEERTEAFTLHYPNVFDVGRAIRDLYGDRVALRTSIGQDDALYNLENRLSRFDLFDGRTQGFGQALGAGGLYGAGGYGGRSGYGGYASGAGNDGTASFLPEYGQQYGQGVSPNTAQRTAQDLSIEQIQRIEQLLERLEQDRSAGAELQQEVSRRYHAPIYVTIAERQNKVLVRTSDAVALEQIRGLVQSLDVPTALVLLEVRVLGVDQLDGFESFFDYQWANGKEVTQFTSGTIGAAAPGTRAPTGTGLRPGDLLFQYVDEHFAARLQLLERDNRVSTLSTPILLTANNEVSRLFVGQEVPLNRSFIGGETSQNESTTTTASGTTGIEFRPVGTTLLITPSINSDRTVTLHIVQETSNVNSTADVLIPSGDTFVSQTVNIVSSQSVSGTIIAKSDLAVAFGGLIENRVENMTEQVPLLGDIPILGWLFRREVRANIRREVVVVVRPYVIGTPAEQASRSARVLTGAGVDLDRLDQPLPDDQKRAPADTLLHDPGRPTLRVHGIQPPAGDGRSP